MLDTSSAVVCAYGTAGVMHCTCVWVMLVARTTTPPNMHRTRSLATKEPPALVTVRRVPPVAGPARGHTVSADVTLPYSNESLLVL